MMGPEDDNDRGRSGAEFEAYHHNGSNKSYMDCPSIKDDKRENEKVRYEKEWFENELQR
jgi:hypothetical protein